MEVRTKYNVGNKLWTINKNKALEFEVESVSARVDEQETMILYYAKEENTFIGTAYEEKYCFASKEELIHSLFD